MTTREEPLSSVLGRTQRAIEASRERRAKRVASEITARLQKLQAFFPQLWYCDGMGSTSLWAKRDGGPRASYTDVLYLAFEHVQYNWNEKEQPAIVCDEDETPEKKAAAAVVQTHGVLLFEIITAGRFLDAQCGSCYGAFPESGA